MLEDYIGGLVHICLAAYQLFYPFVPSSRFYDSIYVLFWLGTLLSYLLLKGECITSLVYKKMKNPDYEVGSDIFTFDDMQQYFPWLSSTVLMNINLVLSLYFGYCIYIVNKRSHLLSGRNIGAFLTIFLAYIVYLRNRTQFDTAILEPVIALLSLYLFYASYLVIRQICQK
jgi:hypothetical protein